MRRGWRTVFDRHLVEGLTVDERIARLEGELERMRQQAEVSVVVNWLEAFEADRRRRRLPFYRRWFTKGSV